MTAPTGIGRGKGGGGAKPGAGRPRLQWPERPADSDASTPRPRRRIRAAKPLLSKAFETLAFVMDHAPSGAARVAAAKAVIELAKAEALDEAFNPRPARRRAQQTDDGWDELINQKDETE